MTTTQATSTTTAGIAAVTAAVRGMVPDEGIITDRTRLRTYECDGLAHYRVTPALVVIPEDATSNAFEVGPVRIW